MGGNWKQIIPIQQATDIRLITPFGLNVQIGDIISVANDGTFTLESSSLTLFRIDPGEPRDPEVKGDLYKTSGQDVKVGFRAAGEGSTLFPNLPKGSAGVDVHFESADAWLLAIPRREIYSLPEVDRFRKPILIAYKYGTWLRNWALVYETVRADSMTLLAATTSKTDVALTLDATVSPQALESVQLTSGVSISQTSSEITQWIQGKAGVVGIRAKRISDPIWKFWAEAEVVVLADDDELLQKPESEFWEEFTEPD